MPTHFIADGESRLQLSRKELRRDFEARYARELAQAGIFGRLLLRWKMAAELRREWQKIVPSATSLYGQARHEVND